MYTVTSVHTYVRYINVPYRFRLRLVVVNSFHVVSRTLFYHYAREFKKTYHIYKPQVRINDKPYFVFILEAASFRR